MKNDATADLGKFLDSMKCFMKCQFLRSTIGQNRIKGFFFSGLLMIVPSIAVADFNPPTGPSQSLDGNYTIYYPEDWSNPGCDNVDLQESSNAGTSWVYVPDYNHDGAVTFTDHPAGLYEYRAVTECEDYYGEYSWEEQGDEITVIVGATPVLEDLYLQLDYVFEVRLGHINSDNKVDLYIKRTSGGDPNDGVLYETILSQNTDGTFTVLTWATTAQELTAASWPIAVVEAVLADFNADGYVDIFLKDLDALIPGVDDLIVFSNGAIYTHYAQASTMVDAELLRFINNVYGWILDPDYFDQYYTVGHYEVGYGVECHYVYEFDIWWDTGLFQDLWWDIECSADDYEYWVPGDYNSTFVDRRAVEAAAILDSIWEAGSFISGASEIIKLGQILEEILGVEIFGGVFGQGILIYIGADDVDYDENSLALILLAQLLNAVNSGTTASSVLIINPLPGSSINKKDDPWSPSGNCTSDGRFDLDGSLGYRGGDTHRGVDLGSGVNTVTVGTNALAAANGTAHYFYELDGGGNYIVIVHDYGFITHYMHLDTTVTTGTKRVVAGEVIGTVGQTGYGQTCSRKVHLHFAVLAGSKHKDPEPIFNWPLEQ